LDGNQIETKSYIYREKISKDNLENIYVTSCIGSGPYCNGQIMVINDLLGLGDYYPEFAKNYVDLKSIIKEGILNYKLK
jgi:3-methyl-2-oxobutanoate hydroxymethyltransferase